MEMTNHIGLMRTRPFFVLVPESSPENSQTVLDGDVGFFSIYMSHNFSAPKRERLANLLNLPTKIMPRQPGCGFVASKVMGRKVLYLEINLEILESEVFGSATLLWLAGLIQKKSWVLTGVQSALMAGFDQIVVGRPDYLEDRETLVPKPKFGVALKSTPSLPAIELTKPLNTAWFISEDSFTRHETYEDQVDYSEYSRESTQVFAYYLPQFHRIPENDLWYGQGFTEWTSVRSARMFWPKHYQRHIPHRDIGFYSLESAETLKRQAEDMRKACVDALVFYHYWFSGKLILEKPSQILLANKNIEMPFFFCWANENWTRKWDGNDDEVLLSQTYSLSDAEAFMEYLIPFFKDYRYKKLDGRPLLNIYRVDLIPNIQEVVDVWKGVCSRHGVAAPYLIASKTRGVHDHSSYSMDAEVERVLFDWTNGAVKSPERNLEVFPEYRGQILDYTEVARFYAYFNQNKSGPNKFRSLVPGWDNTARYGDLSFALSGVSSKSFEYWLKALIEEAGHNDSPFIFINAWNEWAEGAHLEADARYGYANLNSVGRAITGRFKDKCLNQPVSKLYLEIENGSTWHDSSVWIKFFECLDLTLSQLGIDWGLSFEASLAPSSDNDYILRILRPCLFSADAIRKLIFEAGESAVSSFEITYSNTEIEKILSFSKPGPILLYRRNSPPTDLSEVRAIEGSRAYPLDGNGGLYPETSVMSIIKVDNQTDESTLTNSLLCLAVQIGFSPRIMLRCSNRSLTRQSWLTEIVAWARAALGLDIFIACSSSSLRNEENDSRLFLDLERIQRTRFLHYLSAGDEMFPFAYKYLVSRVGTGFLATFARLYESGKSHSSDVELKLEHISSSQPDSTESWRRVERTTHNSFIDLGIIDSNDMSNYFDYHLGSFQLVSEVIPKSLIDHDSLGFSVFLGDKFYS